MFSLSMFGPFRCSVFWCFVPFEVQSFDIQSFDIRSHSTFSLSMFSPIQGSVFRCSVLFDIRSFEVRSFDVQSFEVRSFEVRSFEVRSRFLPIVSDWVKSIGFNYWTKLKVADWTIGALKICIFKDFYVYLGAVSKTSLFNSWGHGFESWSQCFFSVYVTKLPSLILAVSIFSKTIGISYYGLSERIFKLLDYRNIEYRAGKLGKLSDYLISDTKLKLSDYQISDLKKL